MKRIFKILKDEKGRQCEGMILVAIVGIILAFAVPNITRLWPQYSWWSLLSIPYAIIVFIIGILILSLFIKGVTWLSGQRRGGRREIRFWDSNTFKEIKRLKIPRHSVDALSFSPDGRLLATVGRTGSIPIWNIDPGQSLIELKSEANAVAFSPSGRFLATGGDEIQIWQTGDWKVITKLKVRKSFFTFVCFSSDGKLLVAGGREWIYLWEFKTGKLLFRLEGAEYAALSPNANVLATLTNKGALRLVEISTGENHRSLKPDVAVDENVFHAIAFSPDGKIIAGAGWAPIHFWNVETGKQIIRMKNCRELIKVIAFSLDGKLLASCAWTGTIRIWDVCSGKQIKKVSGNLGDTHSIAFSPIGDMLVSGASYPPT